MDNGASSYRRFLQGDEEGFAEIVRTYKDGLILYLNGYVNNLYTAEELTEEHSSGFLRRNRGTPGRVPLKPGSTQSDGILLSIISGTKPR